MSAPAHPPGGASSGPALVTNTGTYSKQICIRFSFETTVPKYDQHCLVCEWSAEILAAPGEMPPCPDCGGATERYYPIGGTRRMVLGDEFVGGKWIENLDTTPVYVESRSQLKREMAKRGLVERVRHIGTQDSDKSAHTSRWI